MVVVDADSASPHPLLNPALHPGDLAALDASLHGPMGSTETGAVLCLYPQATLEGLRVTIPTADLFPLQGGHRLFLNSSW